jgi:DNA-binding IclR family transcriptional regulator
MPNPPNESHSRRGKAQRRTDRLAVLDYLATFQAAHGHAPSQRLIQRALGLSAPSVAHTALHALERDGLIRRLPAPRGYRADLQITPAGQERLAQWRAQHRPVDAENSEKGGAA